MSTKVGWMDDVHVSSSGSANVVATTSTNCHMVCTCANTNHMRHGTLYSKIFWPEICSSVTKPFIIDNDLRG